MLNSFWQTQIEKKNNFGMFSGHEKHNFQIKKKSFRRQAKYKFLRQRLSRAVHEQRRKNSFRSFYRA